jgi:cytoskeleton protein RodZ
MSEGSETLGQRLKAERMRKGLSCQKAADELHLDGWVIEGLESGDYSRIGPSVYAKGHLKRYAELLGLPVGEILEGFEDQPMGEPRGDTTNPPVAGEWRQSAGMRLRTSAPAGSELPWAAIGVVAAVALLVAGVWWWHPWRPRAASPPFVVAAAEAPASAATPPTQAEVGAVPAVPATPGGGAPGSAVPNPVAPPAAIVEAAGAGAGRARLRLLFLADSWVDVHDAAGQRVFAGNGRANNVRSMSGMGPLRVYIKSASSVHVDINNHAVVIGPQFVIDNAAHFEAGADGVLRRDPKFVPPTVTPSAARPHG